MELKTVSSPMAGQYYLFAPDLESSRAFRGATFDNEKALIDPPRLILRPENGGFPVLRETPRIIFDPSKGPAPRDLEGGFSGYWLVSERLHGVMEQVDPHAFAFAECEVHLPDGSLGPRYFLCDVIRELDAVDESASKLDVEVDEDFVNGKFYSIAGGASLAFRHEVLAGSHVFLTPFSTFVITDRAFFDAVHSAGVPENPAESGISFIDASDI